MQAVTKNQLKYIKSLHQGKFRKEHKKYIVEGTKSAQEWIDQRAPIEYVVCTQEWYDQCKSTLFRINSENVLIATPEQLETISTLKTANEVLLTVAMEQDNTWEHSGWILMLDTVQDPGNMGTIIRTADWFGIKQIVASKDCVDIYNPKVIQATMGSLLRVKVVKTDLLSIVTQTHLPTYAAVLGGKDLQSLENIKPGIIIMGNESQGIKPEIIRMAKHPITIGKLGGAESLNVAVATGIICHSLISLSS